MIHQSDLLNGYKPSIKRGTGILSMTNRLYLSNHFDINSAKETALDSYVITAQGNLYS